MLLLNCEHVRRSSLGRVKLLQLTRKVVCFADYGNRKWIERVQKKKCWSYKKNKRQTFHFAHQISFHNRNRYLFRTRPVRTNAAKKKSGSGKLSFGVKGSEKKGMKGEQKKRKKFVTLVKIFPFCYQNQSLFLPWDERISPCEGDQNCLLKSINSFRGPLGPPQPVVFSSIN